MICPNCNKEIKDDSKFAFFVVQMFNHRVMPEMMHKTMHRVFSRR